MLLYAAAGTGSALAEIALDWAGVPYEREVMTWEQVQARSHSRLLVANPLHQLPTLILDNGQVLTESAAIVLWLDETCPDAGLLPARGSAERLHALRWLMFLVTTVYPTFSYGDFPQRYVADETAQRELVASTKSRRKALLQQVDQAALSPWFCGEQPSMLDAYVAVMSTWSPRRPWFTQNAPRLYAIAQRADELPQVAPAMRRNRVE
ncbi:MAG: glutathione S-transferase family protein [Rhodanobacteraceae bacterium]|nr:glutathione S-transferase family protein [Rhodanobacteraceae bacterium]